MIDDLVSLVITIKTKTRTNWMIVEKKKETSHSRNFFVVIEYITLHALLYLVK